MKVSKERIRSFIPQREPFIMIDNLIDATEHRIETDFTIHADSIFLDDGVLSAYALIENIAQSSAAGLAFIGMHANAKPVDGFIGAVSKLTVYKLPGLNDTIHTVVTPLQHFANLYLLKGENYLNGEKLLECEIKLAGIEH